MRTAASTPLAHTPPLAIAAAAIIAAAGVWLVDSPGLAEAWLTAFLLWTGLGVGALGLLMLGHLFSEDWLQPVRAELEAAARTLPLGLVWIAPVLLELPALYVWASQPAIDLSAPQRAWLDPLFFRLRGVAYLVLWSALALWIARPGRHRFASALGLLLLSGTTALADLDLIRSRELAWWAQLQGVAFALAQLLAALAAAMLAELLRGGRLPVQPRRALIGALLVLALLLLWAWVMQFLIVWSANLPEEIVWYLRRTDGAGAYATAAILAMLAIGVFLLALPRPGRGRLFAAGVLLLGQHVGALYWLVRPAAPTAPALWQDVLVLGVTGAIWLLAWLRAAEPHERALAQHRAASA